MATPTKCKEKRPEGADPRTGYRARLLGKETYAYTAPGAMDNRDDRATERSGAEEKEEGTAPQEKGRGRKAPAKKAPGRGKTKTNRSLFMRCLFVLFVFRAVQDAAP